VAALCAATTVFASGLTAYPTAAGATTVPTASITATSSPPVPSTGSALSAGSLTITLDAAASLPTGGELSLFATASSGTVHWNSYAVSVSSGISFTGTLHVGNALNIHLGPKTTSRAATIYVTGIEFTTTSAEGSIGVSANLRGVTFSPATAFDGTIVQTPPSAPTASLASASQPGIAIGALAAAAGDWKLTLSGDRATGQGWTAGATLTVTVAPPTGTNCTGGGYLYFGTTPSVTIAGVTGASVTPTISPSLGAAGACQSTQPNELTLTFTSAVYFDTASEGSVTVVIGDIRYVVGTTATAVGAGNVIVSASFSAPTSSVRTAAASNAIVVLTSTPPATTPGTPAATTSATPPASGSTPISVKADVPPVTVPQGSSDAAISPIDVVGSASTPVPAGYVCLALSVGSFNVSASASVAVLVGNGSTVPNVTYGDLAGTEAGTVEFQVTKVSTTGSTYSVSGLAVDASTSVGPVSVTATVGTSASCALDRTPAGSAIAFTVGSTPVMRIYGATPDATAAAELEHQFDAQSTACPGRAGARPVVLATDRRFPDALASAYLASSLGTGELLTPTGLLSAATANAIRLEGITQVYIVGGPLAVSAGVAQQLESMLAYSCGGSTPLTSAGPVHLEVVRIAGTTAYDTAEWVAQYPPPGTVGSLTVRGAYGGTNPTGGTGRYNDTSGNGSTTPTTPSALPTAIVATGRTFQDAESASVLSYADRLPILLTTSTSLSTQVPAAISDLGIRQVVVMGGPLAVSDGVVAALEALGVPVLRIAGQTAVDTAVQLAEFEMAPAAGNLGAGWAGSGGVTVARGDYFTDGLAGALVAAGSGRQHTHQPQPLLLCTDPSSVGEHLAAFLTTAGRTGIDGNPADRVTALTILGGPDAVSPSTVDTMVGDL